jgi:hypothetical protein
MARCMLFVAAMGVSLSFANEGLFCIRLSSVAIGKQKTFFSPIDIFRYLSAVCRQDVEAATEYSP